ncbi:MAG: hypothetical protein JJU10_00030 [Idiomarina sp.]|nr:hypothetical protein [Idiomarina sp.]
MRKSDKKIDNDIIRRLTALCEEAKYDYTGFEWLTHEVNYQRFPQSLKVLLVFNDEVAEPAMLQSLRDLIPKVQDALEPVIGGRLPAAQIEAAREHSVH